MEQTAKKRVNAKVGSQYTSISLNNYTLQATGIDVRYILLPVYIFSIKSGGNDYKFAVNGQTGKVVGELPIDGKVSRQYMLKKAAIPAAVVALYYILSYFMGWRV